jgi:hypothetical protein
MDVVVTAPRRRTHWKTTLSYKALINVALLDIDSMVVT